MYVCIYVCSEEQTVLIEFSFSAFCLISLIVLRYWGDLRSQAHIHIYIEVHTHIWLGVCDYLKLVQIFRQARVI